MNKENSEYKTAVEIIEVLRERGYEALFAGGSVRDMLLGEGKSSDIDIATNATPSTINEIFNHVIGVGEHFGVMLVIEKGMQFEVATFRSDGYSHDGRHPEKVVFTDAKTDALRRDFTINGMFYDPINDEVIDYVGGEEDLKKGIIRTIGNPNERFSEDYLRLLRAIRFASRFSFDIEKSTFEAIKNNASNITKISFERIFQEIDKMLANVHRAEAIEMLSDVGLLKEVLPEVEAMKGVEQPPQFHPEGDVFVHTLLALKNLKNPSQVAAWSALLHDIGKPPTMRITDRIRFNNHHRVGSNMSREVMHRLKCSNNLTDDVCECVDNHMNFINVTNMRLSKLKRFLARPTLEDELNLHWADCMASHGGVENYDFIREKQQEYAHDIIKPDPLIGGKDLIKLGFKPGPLFGKILDKVYDLQLEDEIKNRDEALDWVKRNGKAFCS